MPNMKNNINKNKPNTNHAFMKDDAYKVLGINPNATDEEVRKAYRKMVIQHHPDKVAHLGDDVKEAATKKLQEINKAKEMIFQARGLN